MVEKLLNSLFFIFLNYPIVRLNGCVASIAILGIKEAEIFGHHIKVYSTRRKRLG